MDGSTFNNLPKIPCSSSYVLANSPGDSLFEIASLMSFHLLDSSSIPLEVSKAAAANCSN